MLIATLIQVDPLGERGDAGSAAAVLVLVSFLVSFLAIRTSARLTRSVSWWPGGVKRDGVHVHHHVWGICLMILSGFLSYVVPSGTVVWHITAIGFGIGAGFALDEFALWVHLEDVYWSHEGRSSIDAVVLAFAFAALVVVGTRPFGLDEPASVWGTAASVAIILVLVVAAASKGRVLLAVLGMFFPVVALYAGVRLAQPSSIWARRFYDERKLARARRRFAPDRRTARLSRRFADLVTGAPSEDRRHGLSARGEPE
jgi:hypothetical protein